MIELRWVNRETPVEGSEVVTPDTVSYRVTYERVLQFREGESQYVSHGFDDKGRELFSTFPFWSGTDWQDVPTVMEEK